MKKTLVVILTLLLVATLFAGCGAKTATEATADTKAEDSMDKEEPAAEQLTIGISMDSLESGFWVANIEGMRAEAEKQGVKIVEVIAEGDANKQNDQIKNLIAQGVDAIICAPKDGSAIEAAVDECNSAGVPIVMNNRPVQGDSMPDLQILSDNYVMAKQAMQWFVDKAKADGMTYKALLLIGDLADENAIERDKGFKEVINANTDVIEIVQEVPSEWDHEVALAGLQNAFQASPEIDLLITPSDFLFPPIKSTLESIGRWVPRGEEGHVAMVSFDGDVPGMQYLKDGYNWVDAAQAATGTGELCIQWAMKLANGEKPDDPILRDPGVIVTIDNYDEVKEQIWGYAGVE